MTFSDANATGCTGLGTVFLETNLGFWAEVVVDFQVTRSNTSGLIEAEQLCGWHHSKRLADLKLQTTKAKVDIIT